mmetsp:Transcript_21977/g.32749  ORF Transcript_21977/g.32749 Transcript_21977/m.32749 type:complete len:209 (-) Transcript_21977:2180-2806(-)
MANERKFVVVPSFLQDNLCSQFLMLFFFFLLLHFTIKIAFIFCRNIQKTSGTTTSLSGIIAIGIVLRSATIARDLRGAIHNQKVGFEPFNTEWDGPSEVGKIGHVCRYQIGHTCQFGWDDTLHTFVTAQCHEFHLAQESKLSWDVSGKVVAFGSKVCESRQISIDGWDRSSELVSVQSETSQGFDQANGSWQSSCQTHMMQTQFLQLL